MTDRDDQLYQARLAEQLERHEDVINAVRRIASLNLELTVAAPAKPEPPQLTPSAAGCRERPACLGLSRPGNRGAAGGPGCERGGRDPRLCAAGQAGGG